MYRSIQIAIFSKSWKIANHSIYSVLTRLPMQMKSPIDYFVIIQAGKLLFPAFPVISLLEQNIFSM
jgi:hypothetical protein